jgi:hypothetical protein
MLFLWIDSLKFVFSLCKFLFLEILICNDEEQDCVNKKIGHMIMVKMVAKKSKWMC